MILPYDFFCMSNFCSTGKKVRLPEYFETLHEPLHMNIFGWSHLVTKARLVCNEGVALCWKLYWSFHFLNIPFQLAVTVVIISSQDGITGNIWNICKMKTLLTILTAPSFDKFYHCGGSLKTLNYKINMGVLKYWWINRPDMDQMLSLKII